jgi:Domain of unknown function (DUF222)
MFGSDPVEQIRLATKDLVSEDRRSWSGAARSERVVELFELGERLQAETLRAVAEWDRGADWALDGALSPRSWLAHRSPIGRLGASRLVRSARFVREHESTGDALADGDISCAHVETMAAVAANREEEFEEHEDTLVAVAKILPPDDFAVVARHWREIADDQLSKLEARERYERRHLHVSTTLFGRGVLDGDLDADAVATLLEALDLAAPPDPVDGVAPPRTLSQRRADALVDIAGAFLAAHGKGGRPEVGLNVVIDEDTLAGSPTVDVRRMRCDLDRVGPISRETALRLACDCAVRRVVMRGESEVLDLGRAQRLASPALRRALVVRDRGCAFPGCDRPPEWCDAHHIIWWERHGTTDRDNCCLLCRRHHTMCHEGGWTIHRNPDGTYQAQEPSPMHVHTRRRGRAPPTAA